MKIALSSDHRGTAVINTLAEKLAREGNTVTVLGLKEPAVGNSADYPDRALLVANAIAKGEADLGILICGTGIGMSIAANKIKGIRAAVVHDELTAALCRSHNNANVLCLSADLLGERLIEKISDVFLKTPFEGGRHARRIHKIEAIEQGKDLTLVTE
jgi:ribose 5-phosphate isomerase B